MPQKGYLTDGQMEFTAGVDSGKVPLLRSDANPNGLRRDQISWGVNLTCRGGGLTQRATWKYLTTIADGTEIYQGGWMYEATSGYPYLLLSVGGRILRQECFSGSAPIDLSAAFGLYNPTDVEQAYFTQGEEFGIIQAGDYGLVPIPTLPLFWDGVKLRRSNGLSGTVIPGPGVNELPAAGPMDYYMQRIWYAQYRTTSAGDIVKGSAGTVDYNQRDSILKVTENPLAIGGDGFSVPTFAGPIRALAHAAAIDTALGQGQLFVFTRKDIYAISVPITRADWTSTTEPLQRVIQKKYGSGSERSIVSVNGDLFYQTIEPGVRTLALAVRYFNQWGNTPISRNLNRLMVFQDRALLRFASGILFDNRLWQTALPKQTTVGVAHDAIMVLDFDLISSFQDKLEGNPIPAWEGIYQGVEFMQLFIGDFGGLERAFAVVHSTVDGSLQLWELSIGEQFENGDNRVDWMFESASLPFNDPFQMKELQGGSLWVDRLYGTVHFLVEYRGDDDPCWHYWSEFEICTARTSCEDLVNPVCYPIQPYAEADRKPLDLPHPPEKECMSNKMRQAMYAHAFQIRVTIKGFCRVRGYILYATPVETSIYGNKVC